MTTDGYQRESPDTGPNHDNCLTSADHGYARYDAGLRRNTPRQRLAGCKDGVHSALCGTRRADAVAGPQDSDLWCACPRGATGWQQGDSESSRPWPLICGIFLALTASSLFWGGQDTGLASSRAVIFGGLPTAGPP